MNLLDGSSATCWEGDQVGRRPPDSTIPNPARDSCAQGVNQLLSSNFVMCPRTPGRRDGATMNTRCPQCGEDADGEVDRGADARSPQKAAIRRTPHPTGAT
jgi:hypothetical protein